MGTISFKNNGISSGLERSGQIKQLIYKIFEKEKHEFRRISFIFSNDDTLLNLNHQFLNHNTLTDILTFTLSGKNLPIISEIYISIPRVKENARTYNVPYLHELYRVMIHGILHLCGYSDHLPDLKKAMSKKEDEYLKYLSFT